MLGRSSPIDSSIIRFPHPISSSASSYSCAVSVESSSRYPRHGRLVASSSSSSPSSSPSFPRVSSASFASLGLRYVHSHPPSPDRDFVPLLVEVLDPRLSSTTVLTERVWLPVDIGGGARPDRRPEVSLEAELLLEVDEFVLTTLPPSVLSAVDAETPPEQLVFVVEESHGAGDGGGDSGGNSGVTQ